MSYLGSTLKTFIEARHTTARAVAHDAGLDESTLSRWINGSRSVSISSLSEVARMLGRSKHETAEIVAAHLRDLCGEVGADSISININGKAAVPKSPSSIDGALDLLRIQAQKNAKVRNLILDLAKLCE